MELDRSVLKILVFSILIISVAESDNCKYKPCNGVEHTMCLYPAELDKTKPGCTSAQAKAGLTTDEKKAILRRHNELRQKIAQGKADGQPPAANMMKLKWNSELETIAQRFMNSCPASAGHDKCRNLLDGSQVGQNSVMSNFDPKNNPNMPKVIAEAVDLWYDEIKSMTPALVNDFSQAQPIFSQVGHYSQLAWAETSMVGCGYVQKDPVNGYQSFVMNCNYAPPGNMMNPGTPVYIVGEACSKCPANTHCSKEYAGLCTDETTEDDSVGGGCGSVEGSIGFVAITMFLVCAQFYLFSA